MVKPRFSNVETVSPISSPLSNFMPSFGGRVHLSSTDRVLIDNGGSGYRALDIYLSLFLNPVVYKGWDKVMSDICSREITVQPADDSDEATKIADFIKEQLLTIGKDSVGSPLLPTHGGLDELYRALGSAYITGISPVELIWGRNVKGDRVVQYFKARDPRLFRMEYDTEANVTRPKLLTRWDTIKGSSIPAHKWIFHRHWALPNDDPYGCGLGRNLYYPVEWQKQLMSYWLMLIDKTVMPSTVGSYDENAKPTEEQVNDFEQAVRNFGQDSAIVLPPGFKIDTLDFKTSNIDLLEKLIERIDAYIESIIVGESSTGSDTGNGLAKDQVSDGLRIMNAKALSDSISHTINTTLVRWLTWANFGRSAPVPTVWRNFSEDIKPEPTTIAEIESIADFVDILDKLNNMNITLDKDYIEKRLGAPLKKPPQTAKPGVPGAPSVAQPQQQKTGTALYDYVPSPAELIAQMGG